jgi:hypothetical protein
MSAFLQGAVLLDKPAAGSQAWHRRGALWTIPIVGQDSGSRAAVRSLALPPAGFSPRVAVAAWRLARADSPPGRVIRGAPICRTCPLHAMVYRAHSIRRFADAALNGRACSAAGQDGGMTACPAGRGSDHRLATVTFAGPPAYMTSRRDSAHMGRTYIGNSIAGYSARPLVEIARFVDPIFNLSGEE